MSAELNPDEAYVHNALHAFGDAIGIDRPPEAEPIDLIFIEAEVRRRTTLRGRLGVIVSRASDIIRRW